ncbi:M48 family metallopeptidase [bacterium]|nr:M48 family metallopeptidase [bacterium]
MAPATSERAKRYEAVQNWLFVAESVLTVVALVVFLVTGASAALADWFRSQLPNPWAHVAGYGLILVIAAKLLFLPLTFFGDYLLEHRYGLSRQTLGGWCRDELKSLGLNAVLGIVVLDVLYWLLRQTGPWWWVAAGAFFLLFGVVLSTLYPVLILPLFYKLAPIEDPALRERLVVLARRVGAQVLGVYRMGMSEKTRKANAALAGLGRTKRILLGDTLLDHYHPDEIEVVMAHELAHYQHGDLSKMLAWGTVTTLTGLAVAQAVFAVGLQRLGFDAPSDLGAFPLLGLSLFLFGLLVLPLNNAFSRWRERLADRTALDLTANPGAFVQAMRRLADQNLADTAPHPVIEFLLHDHPSLSRRIAEAERWQPPA